MRSLTALFLLLAASAYGVERTVLAEVTDVEPMTQRVTLPSDSPSCTAAKPDRSAGLAALLAWDLAAECRPVTEERVSGYRVTYEWAGRSFTTTRQEAPGERIPLRVQFDVVER